MVELSLRSRWLRIVALSGFSLPAGCSSVPMARLDECHKMNRTLQADNARLKDSVLSLKSRNEEIAQRYDDDARRLRVKEDEVRRLTESIHVYQDEREKLARAYEELKDRIQLAANPLATTLLEKCGEFAKGHAGCEFTTGEKEAVFIFASDTMFEPGTDRLSAEGQGLLRSFADLLEAPEARTVFGPSRRVSVRRCSSARIAPIFRSAGGRPAARQRAEK